VYNGALDAAQGGADQRHVAAFMTEMGINSYREYAANYVTLTAPFTYGSPAIVKQATVQVSIDGGKTALLYTLQNGSQFNISLTLPDGLTLASAEDYPDYMQENAYAAVPPSLAAVYDDKPVGVLGLFDLATTDANILAGIDTSADTLPMQIFGFIASNHAGFEDYTVRPFNATGASATALFVWQDLSNITGPAAEVPFQQTGCVLAYDWSVTPYLMKLTFSDDIFSADQLKEISESVSISADE